jgi:large subunit ribosomal protein L7/L12
LNAGIKNLEDEMTKDEILEAIKGMTVLELSELVKEMEEVFGVSAAAPMMAMAGPGAGAAAAEEEQTEFEVVLTSHGDKKIQVIKEVRALTGLGLKEAKELVDSAPSTVVKDVSKEEAEKVKEKISAVGGIVDIK